MAQPKSWVVTNAGMGVAGTAFRKLKIKGFCRSAVGPTSPHNRAGVIYKLGCECVDFYIGETGRTLNIRMKEHKAASRLAAFEKSAVAEHT